MKKRNWVISSVLLGSVLTMSTISVAQACGGSGGQSGYNRGHSHQGQMMHMMGGLDLSKEQRQAIRKIRNEQRDQMGDNQDEMIDLHKALREQAQAENYDAAKVQELASAKAKIMADMTVERIETMNRIRHELTPEQLEKMESFKGREFGRRGFMGFH